MSRKKENKDIPIIGRENPNKNEQRALGGFFVEGPPREDIELVQVEVPVGCQRVAEAFDEPIETDQSISDVLGGSQGFLDEKDLSNLYGFRMVSYTAKADAVIITSDTVFMTEIKTRNQRIEGVHDAYEGFGQVVMNLDRFREDYPSVSDSREVKGLLLAEDSTVDVKLLRSSFTQRNVSFFDPRRGGFLIPS